MKKLFMLLAAVLVMVITGCSGNSDSTQPALSSKQAIAMTEVVSPLLSGSIDITFGSDGKITTPVGNSHDVVYTLGIQSDGKIVAAGYSSNGSDYDFALVRYDTDGSLDTTFGTGGIVTTPIGYGNDYANALGIQSDGKIVAAGSSYNGINYDFALVRYNTDGNLDTTFGTDGIVTTPVGGGYAAVYALGIQSDGRIVTAGYSENGGNHDDFALVRYNTDGSLDTGFGTDGIVTTSIGSGYAAANALRIQSDGRIVIAGYSANGSNYDFTLVRYNTDGGLDTTFGTGGIVTTPIGSGNDKSLAVGIQSDGKILAAGYSTNGSNHDDFALVRYNTDGSLDTGFGTGGKITTSFASSHDIAYALDFQPDGRIVVAGSSYRGSNYNFALVRYNIDGSLDTDFGTGGMVTTPIGSSDDKALALGIQPDGRIVVAGYSENGSNYDFALVRYLP